MKQQVNQDKGVCKIEKENLLHRLSSVKLVSLADRT